MPSIGELFVELGVKANKEAVEKFDKKIKDMGKSLTLTAEKSDKLSKGIIEFTKGVGAVAAAVGAAVVAVDRLTDSLAAQNQGWLNLTNQSDIALVTYQKWGMAGEAVNKSLGKMGAAGAIEQLNKRLFELRLTGQGARGFQLAGINPMGADAEGVLEQIRNRIQGMNNTSAAYLLKQMGIDPKMLSLLRMTRSEFSALTKELERYQLNANQRQQIQQMNMQIDIAKQKLQYLKDRAILAIMPAFIKFMASLARVAQMLARVGREVGKFIVKWRGLVAIVALQLSKLKMVQTVFASIGKGISGLITKIPILGRAFVGLGAMISKAFLPLTALYLLLDDVAVYMNGGGSLLGDFLNWAGEKGSEFGDAYSKMFGGDFFGGLGDVFSALLDVCDDIAKSLSRIIEILTGLNPYKAGVQTGENITKWLMQHFQSANKFLSDRGVSIDEYGNLLKYGVPAQSILYNGNTTNNTDNRQLSMNNTIYTNQSVQSINDELAYANFAFAQG